MINLDEREFACPLPVVHIKEKIANCKEGDVLCVKVNDRVKEENIRRFCQNHNCDIKVNKIKDDEIDIIITVGKKSQVNTKDADNNSCSLSEDKKMVVVVSSNVMGTGDETLGKNLLKAFLFALTKQDTLPDTMLFFNKGAFVTSTDSEGLETLKELENAGVNILTCGTCLDYYGIKEKLAVGGITNMYDIVSIMEKADKIIHP